MDQFQGVMLSMAAVLGPFAPRVLGALLIVLAAWLGARVVSTALVKVCQQRCMDERLQSPGFSHLLGSVGSGLVWLFALPGLLETLELKGLLDPVNVMMSRIMGFVPNLIGTAVVFGVGFLVARILRQIVTGMLRAAGSERMAERMGLSASLGEQGLAGLVGSMVFALVLLPVLVAALEPLGLEAVTKPVSNLLDTVIALIPKLVAAVIILVVAALIGRAVAGVVSSVLAGMGFNKLSTHLGLVQTHRQGGRSPAEMAGSLVMFTIIMAAVSQSSEVLGFAILTRLVMGLGSAMVGLAVAAGVMIGGLWLANWLASWIKTFGLVNTGALANTVRVAVLFFAAALALRQTGLPGDIVIIAFGSVAGAIALGLALAVGLGGQRVAGRLLEESIKALRTKPVEGQPESVLTGTNVDPAQEPPRNP